MNERPTSQLRIFNRFIIDGKQLMEARQAADFSLEDVARMLGCNRSSVSRWERNLLVPSEARIEKLAEIFGTWEFVHGNPNFGLDTRKKGKKEEMDGNGNHESNH